MFSHFMSFFIPSYQAYDKPSSKNIEIIINALKICSQTNCNHMCVDLNTDHMKNDDYSHTNVNIFACKEFYDLGLGKVIFSPKNINYPYNNRIIINKQTDNTIVIEFND